MAESHIVNEAPLRCANKKIFDDDDNFNNCNIGY